MSEQTTTPGPPRKVAIVGGARRTLAPYDDPSWEIWAFSSRVCLRRASPGLRCTPEDLRSQLKRDTKRRLSYRNYMKFLKQLDCPLHADRSESIP